MNNKLAKPLTYYIYEIIGTALLCWSYNQTAKIPEANLRTPKASEFKGEMLFLITLASWDISEAHFNSAISFSEIFFHSNEFGKRLRNFIVLTIL